MRNRWLACGITFATLVALVATMPANASPADDSGDVAPVDQPFIDPRLQSAVDESTDDDRIAVEVLTTDTDAAATTVRALGGVVTGRVPGEVLQAEVPASRLDDLADLASTQYLRQPDRVFNGATRPEFGPKTIAAPSGIAPWHAAGLRGGTKVGIIDYFDLRVWNPAEHGSVPSVANGRMFCRDTSEFAGTPYDYCTGSQINDLNGARHGVVIAEVIMDVAPEADLHIATVGTIGDLVAAIDWFAANGVLIITNSLDAAYDGPGDGTGPLASVVDYAAARGLVWFNGSGDDAALRYLRVTVPTTLRPGQYVDLDPGPEVDINLTTEGLPGGCVVLNGIRWATDWYLPPSQRSNYEVELWYRAGFNYYRLDPPPSFPDTKGVRPFPLRGAGSYWCGALRVVLRVRLAPSSRVGSQPDSLEIALATWRLYRTSATGSAAKPIVDSANPSLVSVGAVGGFDAISPTSAQGPTNDGRTKPDMSARPSYDSSIGILVRAGETASASASAAGVAAILLAAGLAAPGPALAALTKHLVTDLGPPGPDFAFGSGSVSLPAPPGTVATSASAYVPLAAPQRILTTSTEPPFGPPSRFALRELGLDGLVPADATAIAVTLTSVTPQANGFVQMLPTLRAELGGSASLSVVGGLTRSNMAIVPIGEDREVTLYRQAGGHLVVDLLGWFTPVTAPVAAGRLVMVEPVRVLDTRPDQPGPVPTGWEPHRPAPGEVVRVEIPPSAGLPAGEVAALVVNVTATDAQAQGWLRAQPTGSANETATLVYRPGPSVASHAIVPLGADGTISIRTHASAHIVVDLEGYITNANAPEGSAGLFVPLAPARAYDSRQSGGVHVAGTSRTVQVGGVPDVGVPIGAAAVSLNLTSALAVGNGFVTLHATGTSRPTVSSLNFGPTVPVANAGLVAMSPDGAIDAFVNNTTHVIIDINGYFTGPP